MSHRPEWPSSNISLWWNETKMRSEEDTAMQVINRRKLMSLGMVPLGVMKINTRNDKLENNTSLWLRALVDQFIGEQEATGLHHSMASQCEEILL